jgi:D-alanyl-D-alanine carboxypeptidase (penicillin-binding protein 5/6)
MDYLRNGSTELVNENYLTRTYDGLIGIKASHLGSSNYSIIASAEKNGATYVAVVLNSPDKDILNTLAKKLLNKGFNSYVTAEPSFSSELMKPLEVKHGTASAVLVEPRELQAITIAKGSNDIENVVFLPAYIDAPVSRGQRLGEVCFYIGDTMVYRSELIATDSVERLTFTRALKRVLYYLIR